MNSEGKAPPLHLNPSPPAASRLGGQLKRQLLGPTGLSRSMTRNTMFNFAHRFQC
jgi:hypothetical protein